MKTPAPMTWPSFLSGFQHCSVIILLKHSSDPNSAQRTVWIADALQTFLFSWTTCLHRILLVLHGYCNSLKLPIYTVTCTFFFKLLLAFWECHWKLYVQLILYMQFLAISFSYAGRYIINTTIYTCMIKNCADSRSNLDVNSYACSWTHTNSFSGAYSLLQLYSFTSNTLQDELLVWIFFFFFLNIEVRSLPVTNAWKSWKQTTSLLFYHRNTTDYGAANYLILHQPRCFCQPSA